VSSLTGVRIGSIGPNGIEPLRAPEGPPALKVGGESVWLESTESGHVRAIVGAQGIEVVIGAGMSSEASLSSGSTSLSVKVNGDVLTVNRSAVRVWSEGGTIRTEERANLRALLDAWVSRLTPGGR
jgi:hypothetical protein